MGQAGILGVGVGAVVTTGGCCMELKTGTVTCFAGPPMGTACWKAERVTSASGLLPALVTWLLIVAGMVFDGGAASGTSGMGAFDRSVPTGTSKAMVGLYAVVAPRFVTVIADTTISKGLVELSGQTMNVPSGPVVAARCTRSTVASFGSGCSSSTKAP